MTNPRDERRRVMGELLAGPGLRLMVLAVASLAIGGLIALVARGFVVTDALVGYAVAGLLLLAPLPMLAGDATDALLVALTRRRGLSIDDYTRISALAVPTAILVVGMVTYPIVLAIGGIDALGWFVVVGAFVLFGALPVAQWLAAKLRRRREEP